MKETFDLEDDLPDQSDDFQTSSDDFTLSVVFDTEHVEYKERDR